MNTLFDIFLRPPIPYGWIHGLLFTTFTIHLLFVLLLIGTAIISFTYFVNAYIGGRLDEARWDKRILRTFMVHKSVAVVIGVGALLLIQVGFTVPFFTATSLFAPFWMLIILFLIVAFIGFDYLGQKMETHPYTHLFAGIVGCIALLIVPGVFVAVLVTAENPHEWLGVINNAYRVGGWLGPHWVFRYLHIVGAALVFGASFHYLFSSHADWSRAILIRWIIAGLLFQIFIGVMLFATLPSPEPLTVGFMMFGVTAVIIYLGIIFTYAHRAPYLNMYVVIPVLMLILVPMLLARQSHQNRTVLPAVQAAQRAAAAYEKTLAPYQKAAVAKYQDRLSVVYESGPTIFDRSCSFCHGLSGQGNGPAALRLVVKPEDLTAIRTTRPYLHRILAQGVPGSGMPYFAYFLRGKLENVIDHLNQSYGVIGMPNISALSVSGENQQKAARAWSSYCVVCHGADGSGSKLSRGFEPRPPNFQLYGLIPQRALQVISAGYPGTIMPGFEDKLPQGVRWGLVKIVSEKRTKQGSMS